MPNNRLSAQPGMRGRLYGSPYVGAARATQGGSVKKPSRPKQKSSLRKRKRGRSR